MRRTRFHHLVDSYLDRVADAVALLQELGGLKEPFFWRREGFARRGHLDAKQRIDYYFHGVGCYVNTPAGPVDWDFGSHGEVGGFDLWRLKQFVKENPSQFPHYASESELDEDFAAAVADGEIQRDHSDEHRSLFYRTAKYGSGTQ